LTTLLARRCTNSVYVDSGLTFTFIYMYCNGGAKLSDQDLTALKSSGRKTKDIFV